MNGKVARIDKISTGEKFFSAISLSPREVSDLRQLTNTVAVNHISGDLLNKLIENYEQRGWEFTPEAIEYLANGAKSRE